MGKGKIKIVEKEREEKKKTWKLVTTLMEETIRITLEYGGTVEQIQSDRCDDLSSTTIHQLCETTRRGQWKVDPT